MNVNFGICHKGLNRTNIQDSYLLLGNCNGIRHILFSEGELFTNFIVVMERKFLRFKKNIKYYFG